MKIPDKEKVARAWVAEFSRPEPASDRAGMSEADEMFFYAAYRKPEICWELVLRVLALTDNVHALTALAGGPLEELLSQHGHALIERVETLAQQDERFRRLLRGVYRGSIKADVWERIVRLQQP